MEPDLLVRFEERPAPGFGGDVLQRLGKCPAVAYRVFGEVLALAGLEVGGLHQDTSAMGPGALAVPPNVVNAHHYRVRDFTRSWGPLFPADVGDDDSAVADAELRAVVLTDPQALLESKRRASQPTASRTSG
jgi:hypothetical protein